MPSDPLKHVDAGDEIEFYAEQVNAWTDAARLARQQFGGSSPGPSDVISPWSMVIVRNDTGADLPPRSVVRVDDWIISPVNRPLDVFRRPALKANTPNAITNAVAILFDAIPDGRMGRAVINGAAVVDILINDSTHRFAEPISGDNTKLSSAISGPAEILAKETSGSTRRAIVRLNGGSSGGTELKGLTFTSNSNTADSDPGNGLFKWNNATQGSATQLYFDNLTADGIASNTFFASLRAEGFIYLQQSDDSSKWQLWKWTEKPVDGTGYYKFTVTLQSPVIALDYAKTVYTMFDSAVGFTARKNSTGITFGPRSRINLIEGAGVTLTVADNAANDEIDVTIATTAAVFSGARVSRASSQVLGANGTLAAIGFDGESFDTDTYHDNAVNNTRLTVPTTDYYEVGCNIALSNADATARTFTVEITLNGTTDIAHWQQALLSTDTSVWHCNLHTIWSCTAADYFEVRVSTTDVTGVTVAALVDSEPRFYIARRRG
jgi:hypothetical protein